MEEKKTSQGHSKYLALKKCFGIAKPSSHQKSEKSEVGKAFINH
jgi:hypothetical protein